MKHWLIWVSAIAGTILLGALGSGLWEKAIKPLSAWGGRLLLRTPLGLFKWSRDSMYVEIARGRRDRSTLLLVRGLVLALFRDIPTIIPIRGGVGTPVNILADAVQAGFFG